MSRGNYSVAFCELCKYPTVFEYNYCIKHKECSECGYRPALTVYAQLLTKKQAYAYIRDKLLVGVK